MSPQAAPAQRQQANALFAEQLVSRLSHRLPRDELQTIVDEVLRTQAGAGSPDVRVDQHRQLEQQRQEEGAAEPASVAAAAAAAAAVAEALARIEQQQQHEARGEHAAPSLLVAEAAQACAHKEVAPAPLVAAAAHTTAYHTNLSTNNTHHQNPAPAQANAGNDGPAVAFSLKHDCA